MIDALISNGSFSGHETFPFRFSWLPKGVREVIAAPMDSDAFSEERAIITLGVGKNMVKSIKHWCFATQLIEHEAGRGSRVQATALGRRLFDLATGSDPFLEDPATLWLLHWLLVTNPTRATTWRWAFGHWTETEFTRDGMVSDLLNLLARTKAGKANRSSIERDVDTFLHCYVGITDGNKVANVEDALECPMIDLRLIRREKLSQRYEFAYGPKPTIPDAVLGYAVLDFWNRSVETETLTFEKLLYASESPGRVFRFSERSFAERVETIADWTRGAVTYDATAGMRQLYRKKKISPLSLLPTGNTREQDV